MWEASASHVAEKKTAESFLVNISNLVTQRNGSRSMVKPSLTFAANSEQWAEDLAPTEASTCR